MSCLFVSFCPHLYVSCNRIFTAIMPMVAAGLIPDDPTLQPIRRLMSLVRLCPLVGFHVMIFSTNELSCSMLACPGTRLLLTFSSLVFWLAIRWGLLHSSKRNLQIRIHMWRPFLSCPVCVANWYNNLPYYLDTCSVLTENNTLKLAMNDSNK